MRSILIILLAFYVTTAWTQAPARIPYQAVARGANGDPIANTNVTVRFTIRQGTASGQQVWQEQQSATTNALGLFSVEVGSTVSLDVVNWAQSEKFMQVELNTGSGFIDIGTQQMASVPYALYAGDISFNVSQSGDTLYIGDGGFVIVPGISAANASGGGGSGDGGGGSAGTFTGTSNHICGVSNVVNSTLTYNSVIDQDGNVYKTIVIGTQEWMTENLNTSTYRNGDPIVSGLTSAQWSGTTSGAWAYYSDNASFECPYGKLYNFYACTDARQLCPTGWHVPTDAEWTTLINLFDPNAQGGNATNSSGGPLKSTGTVGAATGWWTSPNTGASNSSGFSAIPGGFLTILAAPNNMGSNGYFWTSTEVDANAGYARIFYNNSANVFRSLNFGKRTGFSVRCLKD